MSDLQVELLSSNIIITPSAQDYLAQLLAKQEVLGIGVRIFVEHAGTPRAECCMSYCQPDEIDEDDLQIAYDKFVAHIDAPSIPYLHDAVIDYNKDRFGGQLTFRAPNQKFLRWAKMPVLKSELLMCYKLRLTHNLPVMAVMWSLWR